MQSCLVKFLIFIVGSYLWQGHNTKESRVQFGFYYLITAYNVSLNSLPQKAFLRDPQNRLYMISFRSILKILGISDFCSDLKVCISYLVSTLKWDVLSTHIKCHRAHIWVKKQTNKQWSDYHTTPKFKKGL